MTKGAFLARSPFGGTEDMNNGERADRLKLIRARNEASNNRVQDFMNLFAEMCAGRTRARRARAESALTTLPVSYDTEYAESTEPAKCSA